MLSYNDVMSCEIVCQFCKRYETGSIEQKASNGRPRSVRTLQNILHVSELIYSQEYSPGAS